VSQTIADEIGHLTPAAESGSIVDWLVARPCRTGDQPFGKWALDHEQETCQKRTTFVSLHSTPPPPAVSWVAGETECRDEGEVARRQRLRHQFLQERRLYKNV